ncbi:MAG: hypothetical protein ACYDBB_17990 [Armatimonadota bacterium]
MTTCCKDKKCAEKDAEKAAERKAEGKSYFACDKCGRTSPEKDHLCKPEKAKKDKKK